jgi:hypothetical protein
MRFEAGFVAGYALALLAAAATLHRLGRRNSTAWSSPALAGYRRQLRRPAPPPTDWPHRDVERLHTAIGVVAAAAGSMLVAAELVRLHGAAEIALLAPVGTLALTVTAGLSRRLRR